jgi:hypothetical protein
MCKLLLIDELDLKAELTPLRRDEETKWAQSLKLNIFKKGRIIRIIFTYCYGKHRKKKIFQLDQNEGTIVGQENLKVFITEYYK